MSSTKGMAATAVLLAASRGPFDRHGYHSTAFGWCGSMLLCRVGPEGRTLGRYFVDEVAAPLDAEYYIGLPDEVPDDRVAARRIKFVHRAR